MQGAVVDLESVKGAYSSAAAAKAIKDFVKLRITEFTAKVTAESGGIFGCLLQACLYRAAGTEQTFAGGGIVNIVVAVDAAAGVNRTCGGDQCAGEICLGGTVANRGGERKLNVPGKRFGAQRETVGLVKRGKFPYRAVIGFLFLQLPRDGERQQKRVEQRKDGNGPYKFMRRTERQFDTLSNNGLGSPVNPIGLIVSSFRPSDDATVLQFLIPSNFFAVSVLNKAAEILTKVNKNSALAKECTTLADEVAAALEKYAVYNHPEFGEIYAFEVDGFGNYYCMDDANVPSLLAMKYLNPEVIDEQIYANTRRFVWSESNPYFFRGEKGEGIGGPHIGYDMAWPMSLMMKAFTSDCEKEIKWCIEQLMRTDAGTGFMHESFHVDNPKNFTRAWFAWQNTLFGELIVKQINEGRLEMLNSIELK